MSSVTFRTGLSAVSGETQIAEIDTSTANKNWRGVVDLDIDVTHSGDDYINVQPAVKNIDGSGYSILERKNSSDVMSHDDFKFTASTGTYKARVAFDYGLDNRKCYVIVSFSGAAQNSTVIIDAKLTQ